MRNMNEYTGSVCVIGGANVDICGSSLEPLRNYDSNPGEITISYGGVGRNIAQITSLLGMKTLFVTCFSDDGYGQLIREDCIRLGMDVSFSRTVSGVPSSMYIAILDNNRDMSLAMSDMRILRSMTPEMLDPVLKSLTKNDMIIIDANLDRTCIEYILEHAPCMVAADPVSTSKVWRFENHLDRITIFKPNQYEAQELSGIVIRDETSAAESLDWFLKRGVEEIIISMADKGILLGTQEQKLWITHRMILLENATGGGDSFLGAYICARVRGKTPEEAAQRGISAAVTAIEEDAVRRRSLNMEEVERSIGSMEIKEKQLV